MFVVRQYSAELGRVYISLLNPTHESTDDTRIHILLRCRRVPVICIETVPDEIINIIQASIRIMAGGVYALERV